MKYIIAFLIMIIVTGCEQKPESSLPNTHGQYTAEGEFEEYCKTVKCRENVTVRLKKPDGAWFHLELKQAQPVIQNNMVTILAGETIGIEFDVSVKGPENLRCASSVSDPDRTLTFTLTQDSKLADGIGMILTARNPYERYIKYDLGMQLIDSYDILKTSSCPLMPQITNYEFWPHPIFQLIMTNFRWVDENNLQCD